MSHSSVRQICGGVCQCVSVRKWPTRLLCRRQAKWVCSVLCWGWAATLAEARQRVGRDVCVFPMLCVEIALPRCLPRFRKNIQSCRSLHVCDRTECERTKQSLRHGENIRHVLTKKRLWSLSDRCDFHEIVMTNREGVDRIVSAGFNS